MLEKYGVEHIGQTNLKQSGTHSKFHRKIEALLDKNKIYYESEVYGKFCKLNDLLNKKYSPVVDILLDKYKIVIECNGDFWHANPKIYKDTDIFHTYSGAKTAKEIWEHDKNRTEHIESFGYKVFIAWEHDYNNDLANLEENILYEIQNKKNN